MALIQLFDQSPIFLLSVSPAVVAVAILLTAFIFERRRKSFRISGFPQAAGLPLIGNILVNNIAEQCRLWKYVYGDVFQVQLGEIPILVVNTVAAAKAIFTGHANALSSRPNLWTFHQVSGTLSASDKSLINDRSYRKLLAPQWELPPIATPSNAAEKTHRWASLRSRDT
jgi:hypothetical protein